MFIPLYDTNRLRHIRLQYVTIGLIVVNAVVYLITSLGGENFTNAAVLGLGFIPSVVHDTAELDPRFVVIPESLSYLTYSFLHADIFHLGGNMLFLWVFGDNVEDDLGRWRYLFFYLACAVLASFAYALTAQDSTSPLIGASGAISGVVAAYVLLHPKVKIWVLLFFRIPLKLPAYWAIGAWILYQAYFALYAYFVTSTDDVAWFAHLGGLVAGAILVLPLKRADAPLFDNAPPQAQNDWRDTFD